MTPKEKFNRMTEKLIDKIEKGETGSWIKPWKTGLPQNFMTKKHYSGANILFLWLIAEERNYSSNYWLTFNQIKKLGASVKKGETSIPVFFFKPLEIEEEDKESGKVVKKTVPLLKVYNVFNIDQTTLEIESVATDPIPEIEEFITNTGAVIKNALHAYYQPKNDFIGIPRIENFISEEHYYSTLLHELAHWTGHPTRLNRDQSGKFGTESYAFEELVAETASCFLNAELGIDWEKMQHTEYLESWVKAIKNDPKFLWKAASQAQKVVDFLKSLQHNAA
jgi:antirestriction protein ArdC